jgi:hypothetical protein
LPWLFLFFYEPSLFPFRTEQAEREMRKLMKTLVKCSQREFDVYFSSDVWQLLNQIRNLILDNVHVPKKAIYLTKTPFPQITYSHYVNMDYCRSPWRWFPIFVLGRVAGTIGKTCLDMVDLFFQYWELERGSLLLIIFVIRF